MRKLTAALLVCFAAGVGVQAADPNYHVVKEIQIGGDGGWDYPNSFVGQLRLPVGDLERILRGNAKRLLHL